MQEQLPFYPFKVTSRSLTPTRTNKLRISWFMLGLAFGVTGTLAVMAHFYGADMVMEPMVTMVESPTLAPIATAEKAKAKDAATYPLTLTLKVANGDTIVTMLTDAGVSGEEAHNLVNAIGKAYNFKRMDIGDSITLQLDKNPNAPGKPLIKSVILPVSSTTSLEVTRAAKNKFQIKKLSKPVVPKLKRAKARIDSSLYETGIAQGLPPALLAELITAYSYDVDFQRDIQRGDGLDVLYERMETVEGLPAGYGNILFAELNLGKESMKIYRYVDKSGRADYYNAKGESVRKALLRTPINGAKITSRFGLRTHPILGYSRMHRGVDFGAPTGTPIYAAGDGTVGFAGRKGGYGNYVLLKHTNRYATAYGHVSRFARGISPGKRVKQGQVIAYVGTTGISTGPHLHYEVLVNNDQVNPAGVKFKTGTVLAGKELAAFRRNVETITAQLASFSQEKTNLAMAMAVSADQPASP